MQRDDDRGDDDGRHRLVVHRLGVIGRVAGFDHQRPEHLRSHDRDADREDDDAHGRRDERGQGDPERDPATHQAGLAGASTRAAR